MAALALITVVATALNIILTTLAIREKWRAARTMSGPHPLEPALRDIANAIREQAPTHGTRVGTEGEA